jgi:hypothetical protein
VTHELVVDLYISTCGLPRQRTRDIPEKVVSPEASLKAKTTSFTSLSTVQLVEDADVSPKSSLLVSLYIFDSPSEKRPRKMD